METIVLKNTHFLDFRTGKSTRSFRIDQGLGDYTHIIQRITAGTKVTVEGPYGGLGQPLEDIQNTDKAWCCSLAVSVLHLCWASWKACAKKMPKIKRCSSGVYATRMNLPMQRNWLLSRKICPTSPSFLFIQPITATWMRKKTEAICESAEVPYTTSEFVLCGPKGFMHTIESTLVSKNVPKQKIHFESFGL